MRLTPILRLRPSAALLESLTIPSPQASTTSAAAAASYLVSRTKSNRLPVYLRTQGGGSKRSTLIRRVEGDSLALRDEVRKVMGREASDVVVNPTTGHVVVKGSHVGRITEWLQQKGF